MSERPDPEPQTSLEPLEPDLTALQLAQLRRLRELRATLDHHSGEIALAFARMAEALAEVSRRLAEIAEQADFTPPPWPRAGLARTVELKLVETRELTLRFEERRIQ